MFPRKKTRAVALHVAAAALGARGGDVGDRTLSFHHEDAPSGRRCVSCRGWHVEQFVTPLFSSQLHAGRSTPSLRHDLGDTSSLVRTRS
jgi:hypothetical protein